MNLLHEAFNFDGKVIVIAGGNGQIGSAICKYLSSTNALVIVLDVKFDNLNPGRRTHFLESNVDFSREYLETAINSIENQFGPIYGLINCMNRRNPEKSKYFSEIADYSYEVWNEVIEGNIRNSFLLCREIGLRMAKRKEGSIVNFCSIYGAELGPDLRIYNNILEKDGPMTTPISYSVSKGGIQALTKHLAMAWGKFGVRVNSISPGGVFNHQNQVFIEAYSSRVPMGRLAQVEEVIGLPIFLLSPFSSYITGQNIFVDGGLSSW